MNDGFYDPDFVELLRLWMPKIRSSAVWDSLPGMSRGETQVEMILSLYNAYLNYKPKSGTPFSAYYWIIWRRHRASYLRAFFALKRQFEESTDPVHFVEYDRELIADLTLDDFPDVPLTGIHPKERHVWSLISIGFTATEIMAVLKMSTHTYYKLIAAWKEALKAHRFE